MQCSRRIPSLKALKDSFSMNDIPSTWMLLHLAPNSTFFTSLPRTIGLTYGFDEEWFGTALTFMAVTYQTEVHCHLMQRKKKFHASKLTIFERNSKKNIKVEILEGQSLGYSRNSSSTSEAAKPSGTFAIAIDLQFPRFAHFHGGRGDFYYYLQRYKISIVLQINQL